MSDDEQESNDSGLEIKDDMVDSVGADFTLSVKEAERVQIQSDVENFLKKGGQITLVDSSVMSDPPKRPESNYGGQPI